MFVPVLTKNILIVLTSVILQCPGFRCYHKWLLKHCCELGTNKLSFSPGLVLEECYLHTVKRERIELDEGSSRADSFFLRVCFLHIKRNKQYS